MSMLCRYWRQPKSYPLDSQTLYASAETRTGASRRPFVNEVLANFKLGSSIVNATQMAWTIVVLTPSSFQRPAMKLRVLELLDWLLEVSNRPRTILVKVSNLIEMTPTEIPMREIMQSYKSLGTLSSGWIAQWPYKWDNEFGIKWYGILIFTPFLSTAWRLGCHTLHSMLSVH